MEIIPYKDPAAFHKAALPIYLAHEARYCVALGVAAALAKNPKEWKEFHLGCIEQNGSSIGAFLLTPPHPLSLTDMPKEAMPKVVDHVASFVDRITGVVGDPDTTSAFQEAWCRRSGAKITGQVRQGIFRLDEVKLAPSAPGEMVVAEEKHFDTLLAWNRSFIQDCGMEAEHHLVEEKQAVERLLESRSRYFWVVNDEPVAMAGAAGQTPNGIRVNWVYTPGQLRGKGYATSLVSKLSERLLTAGNQFCFLNTDLSNPTSNGIYQKIGYRRIGDSYHYKFAY